MAWALQGLFSWPRGPVGLGLQIALPGLLGLLVYGLVAIAFGIAEVQDIAAVVGRRLRRR